MEVLKSFRRGTVDYARDSAALRESTSKVPQAQVAVTKINLIESTPAVSNAQCRFDN